MTYEAMFNDQLRASAQRAANATLRRAEHDHGRTMALLVAALAELRKLAPDSLVLISQVQAKIRGEGGFTIDRAPNFQPVWDLKFDLPLILLEVQREHEAEKVAVVGKLEAAQAVAKRRFWRPWQTYAQLRVVVRGTWTKFKYPTVEAAEATRAQALELARRAKLADRLDLEFLLLNHFSSHQNEKNINLSN